MYLKSLSAALLVCSSFLCFAAPPEDSLANNLARYVQFADSVNSAMKYQTGKISLPGGKVTLTVPAGFKFLNQE